MEKAIQSYNIFYSLLSPLVQYCALCHYNHVVIKGKENLPKEGGYILAPCHQQALMEPLAILNIAPKAPVFLARADIFKQSTVGNILNFFKIMPVYRIRDGKESLSKNTEIFEKSRNVLLSGHPLCLMAEGRHNNRHQLLPLVKGMFRIAGETQKLLNDKPLYIVPVGIDFDEYELAFSNLVINIGKPVAIQPFMTTYEDNEPLALNQMRDTLAAAMRAQMHDIRSQEHYEEIYTLCNILNPFARKQNGLHNTAWNRFQMRCQLAGVFDQQEETSDITFDETMALTQQYQQVCQDLHLSQKREAEHLCFGKLLLATITVPAVVAIAIYSPAVRWTILFCLACYPIPFIPTHLIPHKIIADTQFRSSINFGIRFGLSIVYVLAFSIVMGCTHGGFWGRQLPEVSGFMWFALAFVLPFLLAAIAGPLISGLCNICGDWSYYWKKMVHGKAIKKAQTMRKQLESRLQK